MLIPFKEKENKEERLSQNYHNKMNWFNAKRLFIII